MINSTPQKKSFIIPLTIIFSSLIISGAILLNNKKDEITPEILPNEKKKTVDIKLITNSDHILGDPNAPIKIVEYSDFECPFCKKFHITMNKIMDIYGKKGQVAWVYRHFPIEQLHPTKARIEAIISECVAEIGGNAAFWKFTNLFFSATPSNNKTNLKIVIPKIINDLGLNQSDIDDCVKSNRYDKTIQDSIDSAIENGARGTPWSIIVAKNGENFPINGAQPYSTINQLIEIMLETNQHSSTDANY